MGRTDQASVVAKMPVEKLYEALTDPDARETWLPPQGMTALVDAFDLRVGGGYLMTLTYEDASGSPGKFAADRDVVRATFTELVPNERVVEEIVFVTDDPDLEGTMTMTWAVKPVDGGTEVSINATDVPKGIAQADHEAGLNSSLKQLVTHVSR